jgi:hypothetical protein
MPRPPPQGPAGETASRRWRNSLDHCRAKPPRGAHAETAPRASRRSFGSWKSGGPRAGCAVRKCVWYACSVGNGNMRSGASLRAARKSPDGVRIRQAGRCHSPAPGHGNGKAACGLVRHGLGLALTIRDARAAAPERRAFPESARRPATGPFPSPPRLPAGASRHKEQEYLRWLAWSAGHDGRRDCQRNFGLALPPPSVHRTLRQTPGGLPPARPATFASPPEAGVRQVLHAR